MTKKRRPRVFDGGEKTTLIRLFDGGEKTALATAQLVETGLPLEFLAGISSFDDFPSKWMATVVFLSALLKVVRVYAEFVMMVRAFVADFQIRIEVRVE